LGGGVHVRNNQMSAQINQRPHNRLRTNDSMGGKKEGRRGLLDRSKGSMSWGVQAKDVGLRGREREDPAGRSEKYGFRSLREKDGSNLVSWENKRELGLADIAIIPPSPSAERSGKKVPLAA